MTRAHWRLALSSFALFWGCLVLAILWVRS